MNTLTPFSLSGLLAGITTIAFGVLVLLKTQNKKLGARWFLFSLSVGAWGWGSFFMGYTTDYDASFLSWRLAYIFGVIWIPILFFHFVLEFCKFKLKKLLLFQYMIGAILLPLVPTPYFFKSLVWSFDSFYFAQGGILFPFFFVWWCGLVIFSHGLLIKSFIHETPKKKNQIKYFFLATAIGFLGGILCFPKNFGLDFYPWGNFTVFIYPLIMSYAILKYRLMEISLFIKRAALFVSIYLLLLATSIPLFFLIFNQLKPAESFPTSFIILEIVLIGFIFSSGPLLYAFFLRKSGFFSENIFTGLTHELKSPLSNINSALEILLDSKSEGNIDPKKKEFYLDMIQKNSNRLSQFTDDLLLSFKSTNKSSDLFYENIPLRDLLSNVIGRYKAMADQKGLSFEIKGDLKKINFYGDREKLTQVISNLLSNSIKFSDQGNIIVSAELGPNNVLISVQDQGRGINPGELTTIFDRFFQGKNARGAKGTGIGLAIAKTWVEAHGGKIWAESEGEGRGSKITVSIPSQ